MLTLDNTRGQFLWRKTKFKLGFLSTRIPKSQVFYFLTKKRMTLEKMLRKEQGMVQDHVGGLDRIQRAGFVPPITPFNYLELKENINKVNLDSILLESKSLLNKIKKS